MSFAVAPDTPVLRCELRVARTWSPREATGAPDDRELGIAVSRVWLE